MEKSRVILALVLAFGSVVIIKVMTTFIERNIHEALENAERIIRIVNDFYPLLTIGFSILLTFTYPAVIFEKHGFILNLLLYTASISLIYHWLYKIIIDKLIKYIQNFKGKI